MIITSCSLFSYLCNDSYCTANNVNSVVIPDCIAFPSITILQGAEERIYISLLLFEQHISSLRSLDTDTGCNQLRSVPHKQRPVSRIFVTDYGIVRFHFHSLIGCGLRRIRQREIWSVRPFLLSTQIPAKSFKPGSSASK